jgi:hypothetical protein
LTSEGLSPIVPPKLNDREAGKTRLFFCLVLNLCVLTFPFSFFGLKGPLELNSEEPFHRPIQFMDELVRISEKLGTTPPDQYNILFFPFFFLFFFIFPNSNALTETNAQLQKLNNYLQKMNELYPRSFVYIPLLKMGNSSEFHKVQLFSNLSFSLNFPLFPPFNAFAHLYFFFSFA